MNIYDKYYEKETDKVLKLFDAPEAEEVQEETQKETQEETQEETLPKSGKEHLLRGALIAVLSAAALAGLLHEIQTACVLVLASAPLGAAWLGSTL